MPARMTRWDGCKCLRIVTGINFGKMLFSLTEVRWSLAEGRGSVTDGGLLWLMANRSLIPKGCHCDSMIQMDKSISKNPDGVTLFCFKGFNSY